MFHVGVKEKVFIHLGQNHPDKTVILYLEHEQSGIRVTEKETVVCADERHSQTVELMVIIIKIIFFKSCKGRFITHQNVAWFLTDKHRKDVNTLIQTCSLPHAGGREHVLHQEDDDKGPGVKTQGLHLYSDQSANVQPESER